MIYVQYNPDTGFIGSTVQHHFDGDIDPDAPECEFQIAVPDDTVLKGMKVDLQTLELVPNE